MYMNNKFLHSTYNIMLSIETTLHVYWYLTISFDMKLVKN